MFVVSKLLSAITQPVFWLALWWLLALLLLSRQPRLARRMLWAGLVVLGLLGFQAGPDALLRPLENRYAVPAAERVPEHAGVIVLGGALEHPASWQAHGQVPLGQSVERMTVPVGWMHAHPELQLVFSGGEGRLLTTGVTDGQLATQFYREQGLDMARSVPEFEAVGCQITPYPVDFRTGESTPWTEYRMAESLLRWQVALHEWLGQLAYALTR